MLCKVVLVTYPAYWLLRYHRVCGMGRPTKGYIYLTKYGYQDLTLDSEKRQPNENQTTPKPMKE